MQHLFSILLLGMVVSSCFSKKDSSFSQNGCGDTDKNVMICVEELHSPDTLLVLMEDYPVEMNIYNDVLYVVMAKTDTCIHLFDKRTGRLLNKLGTLGNGPGDVISPEFIRNNFEYKMLHTGMGMYDMNTVNQFIAYSADSLGSFEKISTDYLGWGSLNMNQEYLVGKHIGDNSSMFKICDLRTQSIVNVPLYPELPSSLLEKNKINYGSYIVPMYYVI